LLLLTEIKVLLQKEWLSDMRSKHAIAGVLLFMLSTSFVSYLSFAGNITPQTWNALLWIIIMFSATQAANRSFIDEKNSKALYTYTLVSPQSLILAKMLYNAVFISLLSVGCLVVFSLLLHSPIVHHVWFIVNLIIGSVCIAFIMTFIAGISSQSSNQSTNLAILSFPLLLPSLLSSIKFSGQCLAENSSLQSGVYLPVSIALSAIILALAYVLFPYIWRD
jgi:heme exporter protein B